MTPDDALLALAHVVEPGDERIGRMVDSLGPEAVIARLRDGARGDGPAQGLQARLDAFDRARAQAAARDAQARIVLRDSPEWPSQLDHLGPARPFALWVVGGPHLRLAAVQSVAVIGARASTAYGERLAHDWTASLADAGWTVVSGGAHGIDGAAHRGALAAGGVTICVLASGVDVAYPRAHAALIARIADTGLLVSESPPGSSARRQRFLTRNRIIAALTRGTVVIEAALRSGTTSTANAAHALNRPVLAAPGPVTSPMSAGCHQLIRDQRAVLASQWGDVVDLLGAIGDGDGDVDRAIRPAAPTDALTHGQRLVLDALPLRTGLALDAVVRESGLSASAALACLGVLTAAGLAEQRGDTWRAVRV